MPSPAPCLLAVRSTFALHTRKKHKSSAVVLPKRPKELRARERQRYDVQYILLSSVRILQLLRTNWTLRNPRGPEAAEISARRPQRRIPYAPCGPFNFCGRISIFS